MRYFSAESSHGTASSHGFSNDTRVLAWASRAARDAYVEARSETNISVTGIPARKATTYAANYNTSTNHDGRPRPFSGEFWRLDLCDWRGDDLGPDFLGEVCVGSVYEPGPAVRLFA